jgi:hypothetical protein
MLRYTYFECLVYSCFLLRLVDEVTKEWKRLHGEELYDPYCSPNVNRVIKARRMGRAGHVAYMADRRGEYRVLMTGPEGDTLLGKHRLRWKDKIIMCIQ